MPCSTPCATAFLIRELRRNGVDLRSPLTPLTPTTTRDDIARDVGDRDDRVVERRRDVSDAALDVSS